MKRLLLCALLLASVARAQDEDGSDQPNNVSATRDTDPTANPRSQGGVCVNTPDPPAPATPGKLMVLKDLGAGTFPDVAFYKRKLWIAVRRGNEIDLYNSQPDLSGLTLYKKFPLLAGAGGFPRLTVACGALWLAFRDGEPAEAIKLWRSDTGQIQDLGPGWGNHPVALGSGMVAWNASDRFVYRRPLQGGGKVKVREAMPTGVSRILPNGAVRWWDEDRTAVPWGLAAWYARDLVVAEDFHDNGVWVSIAGAKPFRLWEGSRAFIPHAAADGAGRYAVAVWQPTARVAVFNKEGAAGGEPGSRQNMVLWTRPENNASGRGVVNLSGAVAGAARKVEILVNLRKVGDARLVAPAWSYDLDTSAYSGGINVSALATFADGKTVRETIRFNVR